MLNISQLQDLPYLINLDKMNRINIYIMLYIIG